MSKKSKQLRAGIDAILGGPELVEDMERPALKRKTVEKHQEPSLRTTTILPESMMERLKALAYWDRVTISEMMAEALTTYYDSRKQDEVVSALEAYRQKFSKEKTA